MINLKDVTALDILPDFLCEDDKIKATSYAMNQTVEMILNWIDRTSGYALVDELPEEIVDLLALEFRAQYYDTAANVEEKRGAVKKALLWYRKAGTKSAVQELCKFIFGESTVLEWFDYSGRPYTFKIEILEENRLIDTLGINNFIKAVKNVKNTRSLLEAIIFHRKADVTVHAGAAATSRTRQVIVDFFTKESEEEIKNRVAEQANEAFKRQNIVDFEKTEREITQDLQSKAIFVKNESGGMIKDGSI